MITSTSYVNCSWKVILCFFLIISSNESEAEIQQKENIESHVDLQDIQNRVIWLVVRFSSSTNKKVPLENVLRNLTHFQIKVLWNSIQYENIFRLFWSQTWHCWTFNCIILAFSYFRFSPLQGLFNFSRKLILNSVNLQLNKLDSSISSSANDEDWVSE